MQQTFYSIEELLEYIRQIPIKEVAAQLGIPVHTLH